MNWLLHLCCYYLNRQPKMHFRADKSNLFYNCSPESGHQGGPTGTCIPYDMTWGHNDRSGWPTIWIVGPNTMASGPTNRKCWLGTMAGGPNNLTILPCSACSWQYQQLWYYRFWCFRWIALPGSSQLCLLLHSFQRFQGFQNSFSSPFLFG